MTAMTLKLSLVVAYYSYVINNFEMFSMHSSTYRLRCRHTGGFKQKNYFLFFSSSSVLSYSLKKKRSLCFIKNMSATAKYLFFIKMCYTYPCASVYNAFFFQVIVESLLLQIFWIFL